jgi:hypothetical protein
MGSLAAGASAVVGTGALSKTEIDRGMTGTIADDSNSAYVTLGESNSINNRAHVDTSGTEIVLDFGDLGGNGAGLNADSKNWFDRVFRITLNDVDVDANGNKVPKEDYQVWITKQVSKRGNRLNFYQADARGGTLVGETNSSQLNGGYSRRVGVMINLLGLNLDSTNDLEDVFGADPSFRIHLERT